MRLADWVEASTNESNELRDGQINVPQDEQYCQDPDEYGNFSELANPNFDNSIRNETQAETCGDTKGQRSGEHCDEGGNGLAEIAPFDEGNRLRH